MLDERFLIKFWPWRIRGDLESNGSYGCGTLLEKNKPEIGLGRLVTIKTKLILVASQVYFGAEWYTIFIYIFTSSYNKGSDINKHKHVRSQLFLYENCVL